MGGEETSGRGFRSVSGERLREGARKREKRAGAKGAREAKGRGWERLDGLLTEERTGGKTGPAGKGVEGREERKKECKVGRSIQVLSLSSQLSAPLPSWKEHLRHKSSAPRRHPPRKKCVIVPRNYPARLPSTACLPRAPLSQHPSIRRRRFRSLVIPAALPRASSSSHDFVWHDSADCPPLSCGVLFWLRVELLSPCDRMSFVRLRARHRRGGADALSFASMTASLTSQLLRPHCGDRYIYGSEIKGSQAV